MLAAIAHIDPFHDIFFNYIICPRVPTWCPAAVNCQTTISHNLDYGEYEYVECDTSVHLRREASSRS